MTGSDSESLFDGLDDFLDLPNGDIDSAFSLVPNCNALFDGSTLWPSQSGSLQPPNDGIFSCNSATNPCAERDLPIEDIVQLEWLSNFCDDSFSEERHTINEPDNSVEKDVQQIPGLVVPVKPRSKRPRPATFNPHSAIHLIFPASSVTEAEALQHQPLLPPKVHSDYEKFAGSRPAIKIRKQASRKQKKKKKIKQITLLLAEAEGNQSSGTTQGAVKQVKTCCHCKTTHTPQWRIGPKDRETLCNACGIRYRSGNLYPEYRPLGSPTFVPTRDSRSFKKVLEMRNKGSELVPFGETTTATTDTTEHIPNTDHSISLTCDREEDVVEDNVP